MKSIKICILILIGLKMNSKRMKLFFDLDLNNLIRILGTVANRYIIVETKESILIVDFHAAHERYIFEELKKTDK